jgi:hypothetical protein
VVHLSVVDLSISEAATAAIVDQVVEVPVAVTADHLTYRTVKATLDSVVGLL